VDQGGEARDQHDRTLLSGFRARRRQDLEETATLLEEVQYDAVFAFKYSPRPNTPAIGMADSIPDEEKSRRLQVLLDRQREIQRKSYARHLGQVMEVMVEGYNHAARAGGGAQLAEQDGELYDDAADSAGDGELSCGEDYADVSQQPCGRGV
jgi:tRNA A37 methylthiotransferase MiaB